MYESGQFQLDSHRRLAEPARAGNTAEIAANQCHSGTLHRYIGAGCHRNTYVGLGQRRSVVDAIAGHGDFMPVRPQHSDGLPLLIRQHLRLHIIDSDLQCNNSRGSPVVPGQRSRSASGVRVAVSIASVSINLEFPAATLRPLTRPVSLPLARPSQPRPITSAAFLTR